MPKVFSSISSALPGEVIAAILLYAAGYVTNELIDLVNKKRKITTLTRRTEVAFKGIELAEKKYPGPGKGQKKLKFSAHYLLANTKIKKYSDAQNLILQCFPLTNLSP
ncbi:hypothetical protein IH980_00675 [Patescibacteria group bacterium]|nr:hypothetical protein [Patescibacteria group bacterium]